MSNYIEKVETLERAKIRNSEQHSEFVFSIDKLKKRQKKQKHRLGYYIKRLVEAETKIENQEEVNVHQGILITTLETKAQEFKDVIDTFDEKYTNLAYPLKYELYPNSEITDTRGGAPQMGTVVKMSKDGSTLVFSSVSDDVAPGSSIRIYRKGPGGWYSAYKITPTELFGTAFSISEDGKTIAIGSENFPTVGCVWVYYESAPEVWTLESQISPSDNIGNPQFGKSVSLSSNGNTLAIGGPSDDTNNGAVWIWARTGTTWAQQHKITVSTGVGANVGCSVALSNDGNTLAFGGNAKNSSIGGVWIWGRGGIIWTQQAILDPSNPIGASNCGFSISISGNGQTVIAGGHTDNNTLGAVWVWKRLTNSWNPAPSKIVGYGLNGVYPQQGYSVDADESGDIITFGGPANDSVWVYKYIVDSWFQQEYKISPLNSITPLFGASVSLSSDAGYLVVGGPNDSSNVGKVWIYTKYEYSA